MPTTQDVQRPEGAQPSGANLAAGLAAAAVAAWLVLMALAADGPIWIVVGVLALAASVAGWLAGAGGLPRGRALAAFVVGDVLFVMFVVFTIMEA